MERAIVGFQLDTAGEWVAALACGHLQPIPRPWVLDAKGRREHLGKPLECRLCAQAPSHEAGGEAACFAHLICPDCGVVLDGSPHRPGCASAA